MHNLLDQQDDKISVIKKDDYPPSGYPNYFVVNKINKSIYYEAIDHIDADLNCPPNHTIICVSDEALSKFIEEYNN